MSRRLTSLSLATGQSLLRARSFGNIPRRRSYAFISTIHFFVYKQSKGLQGRGLTFHDEDERGGVGGNADALHEPACKVYTLNNRDSLTRLIGGRFYMVWYI
jgi:hypothetical protein